MMKSPKVVVVIPIHSETPTDNEVLSFAQCFKILNKHNIFVVAPLGINLEAYKEVNPKFDVKFISPVWFSSIKQYNKLKCSTYFYDLFKSYDFLLTYELDAFVFKDELLSWCEKGYDYIGAPWVEGWNKPTVPIKFLGVGNSGFSLRKVNSCRQVLKYLSYLEVFEQYQNFNWGGFLPKMPSILKLLLKARYTPSKFEKTFDGHEDGFWCIKVPEKLKGNKYDHFFKSFGSAFFKRKFKIAPVEEAIKFSFEVSPRELHNINQNNLPFGCHAWAKYNLEFWKPFIFQAEQENMTY